MLNYIQIALLPLFRWGGRWKGLRCLSARGGQRSKRRRAPLSILLRTWKWWGQQAAASCGSARNCFPDKVMGHSFWGWILELWVLLLGKREAKAVWAANTKSQREAKKSPSQDKVRNKS